MYYNMPITLFVNNNPSDSNTKVNAFGNQVTVSLNPAVHLDNKKEYVLRVLSAQVLYCILNVFTGKNDKIYYAYKGGNYTIAFPQGIYTFAVINITMHRTYLVFMVMLLTRQYTLFLMIQH